MLYSIFDLLVSLGLIILLKPLSVLFFPSRYKDDCTCKLRKRKVCYSFLWMEIIYKIQRIPLKCNPSHIFFSFSFFFIVVGFVIH